MPRFLPKACVLLLCVVGCDLRPAKAPSEATPAATEEAKALDRQTTLSGAREYAIELLEHGQYAALAINVIDISMLERMAATHPNDNNVIEGAIEDFASSGEPVELLEQLRDSRGRTPVISGDVARFDDGVSFERINGRWYLK